MRRSFLLSIALTSIFQLAATTAAAQDAPSEPTGAPPPDEKALVAAPAAAEDAPEVATPTHSTDVTLSAGGQWATGNSQLLAGTVNGAADIRRGANGFGAGLLANYGQGAPGGKDSVLTSENVQGRLRYDRYLIERLSVFMIGTGRYDRFQGLDFRLNIDPGVKYLFVNSKSTTLWGEAGYDFQYDIRRNADRVVRDDAGNPIIDPNDPSKVELLDKTKADHSTRLFAGFKHAFNKEVTLTTGLEYLQSVVHSTQYRVNYDALLAANLGAGLSLGVGFTARYDHDPLPAKEDLDTTTTLNLIYAFSDVPPPPPDCSKCTPPEPPPPPPPQCGPPMNTPPSEVDHTPPVPVEPPIQTMVPPSPSSTAPTPLPNDGSQQPQNP